MSEGSTETGIKSPPSPWLLPSCWICTLSWVPGKPQQHGAGYFYRQQLLSFGGSCQAGIVFWEKLRKPRLGQRSPSLTEGPTEFPVRAGSAPRAHPQPGADSPLPCVPRAVSSLGSGRTLAGGAPCVRLAPLLRSRTSRTVREYVWSFREPSSPNSIKDSNLRSNRAKITRYPLPGPSSGPHRVLKTHTSSPRIGTLAVKNFQGAIFQIGKPSFRARTRQSLTAPRATCVTCVPGRSPNIFPRDDISKRWL